MPFHGTETVSYHFQRRPGKPAQKQATIAGLETMPVIVREMDDDEAVQDDHSSD